MSFAVLLSFRLVLCGVNGAVNAPPDVSSVAMPRQVAVAKTVFVTSPLFQQPDAAAVARLAGRRAAWCRCMTDWVDTVCDPTQAQSTEIQEIVRGIADKDVARLARQPPVRRRQGTVSDELPLRFTDVDGFAGAGRRVVATALMAVFDKRQQVVLSGALEEQVAFQNELFVHYAVSVIDRELYLSDDQRWQFRQEIARGRPLNHGLFRFVTTGTSLPCRPITTLLARAADVLTPRQKEHLEALQIYQGRWSGRFQPQTVTFLRSRSNQWDDQIDQVLETQRRGCELLFTLRIDGLQIRHRLSKDQLRRLTLASRGATSELLSQWQTTSERQLAETLKKFGHDQRWTGSTVPCVLVQDADSHPIWLHAVDAILQEGTAVNTGHIAAQRAAVVDLTLAMLDQELWLAQGQREPLRKLIQSAMPQEVLLTAEQETVRELVLFARPLFRLSEPELTDVLTKSQMAAWRVLKQSFETLNGENVIPLGADKHVAIETPN
jgi:hypothetical protein